MNMSVYIFDHVCKVDPVKILFITGSQGQCTHMHCFCMLLQWITWQTVPLPIWIRHTKLEFSVPPSASCIVSGCHTPPCHHTVLPTRTCHIMSVSRSALCLVLCETQPYNCNWCSYLDALHATAALEKLDCFPQSLRFYRDPWHNLCPNNYAQTHARKNASITSRHIARAVCIYFSTVFHWFSLFSNYAAV